MEEQIGVFEAAVADPVARQDLYVTTLRYLPGGLWLSLWDEGAGRDVHLALALFDTANPGEAKDEIVNPTSPRKVVELRVSKEKIGKRWPFHLKVEADGRMSHYMFLFSDLAFHESVLPRI